MGKRKKMGGNEKKTARIDKTGRDGNEERSKRGESPDRQGTIMGKDKKTKLFLHIRRKRLPASLSKAHGTPFLLVVALYLSHIPTPLPIAHLNPTQPNQTTGRKPHGVPTGWRTMSLRGLCPQHALQSLPCSTCSPPCPLVLGPFLLLSPWSSGA